MRKDIFLKVALDANKKHKIMKKLFILSLVLFSSLSALAQTWEQYKKEADELKGTPARSYHSINIPEQGIVMLYDNLKGFAFGTYEGIFNYEKHDYDLIVVNGIVGMYDDAGKLIGKEEIMATVNDENPKQAFARSDNQFLKNTSGIKKVVSWIQNNKGSVRIVFPRYGESDFDVTIPTFLSQKTNKSKQAKPKGNLQRGKTSKPVRK